MALHVGLPERKLDLLESSLVTHALADHSWNKNTARDANFETLMAVDQTPHSSVRGRWLHIPYGIFLTAGRLRKPQEQTADKY